VPSVAELPTCQNRPSCGEEPRLMKVTSDALAVVRVLPIRNTHIASLLPSAFRVSDPVNWADESNDRRSWIDSQISRDSCRTGIGYRGRTQDRKTARASKDGVGIDRKCQKWNNQKAKPL